MLLPSACIKRRMINLKQEENIISVVPPVLRRIYAARGISSTDELVKELKLLIPPSKLLNIEKSTDLLLSALMHKWRILVVADFDTDGATSCALALRALKNFGAAWYDYLVPNRLANGYGLTPELVQSVADKKKPNLIITVDNGISSYSGVMLAKNLGIMVLITDHHIPIQPLPPADVIINPNQPGDEFPNKNLAGVGVIFYVMLALRTQLKKINWFFNNNLNEPNMAHFLDLVALGTVADVVPLCQQNRILVEQGLQLIRVRKCVPGITALCHIAGINQSNIVTSEISFNLAPRLNAAGRISNMARGIDCLLCEELGSAKLIAMQLDKINRERIKITNLVKKQVLTLFKNKTHLREKGICLFSAHWHLGIIGIIASWLKEQLARPVIVFSLAKDNIIKGSGRSIEGINLCNVLASIAVMNPTVIEKFGGHAMAVGLTIKADQLSKFSKLFNEEICRLLGSTNLCQNYLSDGELDSSYFSIRIAELIRFSGPWGQGFPEPTFDGIFKVIACTIFGNKHLKLLLQPDVAQNMCLEAIAFNVLEFSEEKTPSIGAKIRVVYQLSYMEYGVKRIKTLQLIIKYIELNY